VSTLAAYLPLLRTGTAECEALLRDLLISVSSFFRDPDAFEGLARFAPTLFEGKGPEDALRVWVVGCATGEEVYSVAMVLAEIAASLKDPPRLQLFATDIDEKGYAWGREGLYPAGALGEHPAERCDGFSRRKPGVIASRSRCASWCCSPRTTCCTTRLLADGPWSAAGTCSSISSPRPRSGCWKRSISR